MTCIKSAIGVYNINEDYCFVVDRVDYIKT